MWSTRTITLGKVPLISPTLSQFRSKTRPKPGQPRIRWLKKEKKNMDKPSFVISPEEAE